MDSMRSLDSSLPRSSPHHARRPPPGDLLQAFKNAALSVTQLYKTATTDSDRSRAAGYQDALDDLLIFLDRENLGLGDGEGWRVRQWATERLSPTVGAADSDGDAVEDVERAKSESPIVQPQPRTTDEHTSETTNTNTTTTQPPQAEVASAPQPDLTAEAPARPHEIFHFQAHAPFFEDIDMDILRTDPPTSPSALRFEVLPPRGPRSASHRHGTREKRSPVRSAPPGSKRKSAFGDLFDVSGLGGGRDGGYGGGGGNKRSRLS